MKTTQIEFNGISYDCRIVESNDGEELTIAPLSLYDAIHPNEWGSENDGFVNKEAERIDETVFFYIDNDTLKLEDDELIDELKESNPDFF